MTRRPIITKDRESCRDLAIPIKTKILFDPRKECLTELYKEDGLECHNHWRNDDRCKTLSLTQLNHRVSER